MSSSSSTSFLLVFLSSLCLMMEKAHLILCNGDPTDGFVPVVLTEENFEKQWPYNLQLNQRYSYVDGVRRLWVYSTDKPHFLGSKTKPRTEIGIKGYSYTSGIWQFEGHAYVPKGTSGVCIMQIFGASESVTDLMLWVENGAIMYYEEQLVEDNIYDRWFRLNVIHDTDARYMKVFIDGDLKLTVGDRGRHLHSFKFGVYEQRNSSKYMESQWQGVTVLKASHH